MTRTKAQRVIKYTTLLAQTYDGKFSLLHSYVEWFNEQRHGGV